MPFKEHPEFLAPDSPNARIWRYMDLTSFLSILDRQALYFVRLDKLSEFDPFEGYYTHINLLFDNLKFEEISDEWKESMGIKDPKIFQRGIDANRRSRELVKYHREMTFVNSWHVKDHESAAMWKIYLSNDEGIAIQSTFQKLVDSLADYKDFDVFIGRIKYIDYEKEAIPMGNIISPFVYKRKSFEHEDELRCLIWTPQYGKNDLINPANNKYKDVYGFYVPADIERLIEQIYVAPNAPRWIVELIASLTSKYGLQKKVIQSNLASRPVY